MFKKGHGALGHRVKKITLQRRCIKCKKIYAPSGKDQIGNICTKCYYRLYAPDAIVKKKAQQVYEAVRRPERYGHFLAWVEKNKMRRREIALASYHRRKQLKEAVNDNGGTAGRDPKVD